MIFAKVYASSTWVIGCYDSVGCTTPPLESEAATPQEARREAFAAGWRVDRYGTWYCEPCAERLDGDSDDEDRWVPLHLIQRETAPE